MPHNQFKRGATSTNTSYLEIDPAAAGDTITGTPGNDILVGGSGDDVISGGTGVDNIWGGEGVDTLTGGGGRDRFEYHSLADAGDTITDFQSGRYGDVIDLSGIAQQFNWLIRATRYWSDSSPCERSGSDTIVQIDADGGGDGFQDFLSLCRTSSQRPLRTPSFFDPSVGQRFTRAPTFPSAMEGDTISGTHFGDVFYADAQLRTSSAFRATTSFGSVEDNILEGGADDDVLVGDAGNDQLDGGIGIDWMEGGQGDDTYIVDHPRMSSIEFANSGYDTVISTTVLDLLPMRKSW